jgi:hypothetical protein
VIPPHHDPACWGCGDAPGGIHLPQPTSERLTEYEAWFAFEHFLATPEGRAAGRRFAE